MILTHKTVLYFEIDFCLHNVNKPLFYLLTLHDIK